MPADELLSGRYALRGVLGYGGMAEVRDGWDIRLGRAVAVKLLHPRLAGDAETLRRFEHEARSAAALSHPNVVAIYDRGEHQGTSFIVMERLPGHSLADLVARGPLTQAAVRTLLAEVLGALAAAHQAGILHRDVKPGNILFTASGTAKVADFGIAKTTDASMTQVGQVVGTVAYLSPDRLLGRPATPADDLYAVGVVAYEALTGHRAFPQDTLGSLSHAIMTQRPRPLAVLRPDVDPALAAFVERAMAPQAQWRFGSAAEMADALAGRGRPVSVGPRPSTMVMTSPVPQITMPPPVQVRRRAPSRTRRLVALGAGVVAVIVAAAAFIIDSWANPAPVPSPPPVSTTSAPPTTSAPGTTITTTTTTDTTPPVPVNPPKKRGRGHGGDG
ncbi:serine/threonine-protein kinase [Mycolicibacterium sp. 050158]|uniref:serine/threonine-protein kinase n=1 Tax=Mycolicibacterium sp. 050158 TaxID=3090602 RepID=UPI00299DCD47|nr:serine/threonine-protein kinase [Mycolicibacterium sp. 050158]MDX1890749.1 serine/threonine-protein kinase [Mycolicibacterium sp. 050158]